VDPRTSNSLMFEQLETQTKNSRKIRFWNSKKNLESRTKNLSKEKSSGGDVNEPQLSTSGFQMKKVTHIPVNSNIPPAIIIDWLFYNIFMYVLL
jgi:hypothetical protein